MMKKRAYSAAMAFIMALSAVSAVPADAVYTERDTIPALEELIGTEMSGGYGAVDDWHLFDWSLWDGTNAGEFEDVYVNADGTEFIGVDEKDVFKHACLTLAESVTTEEAETLLQEKYGDVLWLDTAFGDGSRKVISAKTDGKKTLEYYSNVTELQDMCEILKKAGMISSFNIVDKVYSVHYFYCEDNMLAYSSENEAALRQYIEDNSLDYTIEAKSAGDTRYSESGGEIWLVPGGEETTEQQLAQAKAIYNDLGLSIVASSPESVQNAEGGGIDISGNTANVIRIASPRERFPQFFEYVESINCTDSAVSANALNAMDYHGNTTKVEQVFIRGFEVSEYGAYTDAYIVLDQGTLSFFNINGDFDEAAIDEMLSDMETALDLSDDDCRIGAGAMQYPVNGGAYVRLSVGYGSENDAENIKIARKIRDYLSERYELGSANITFGNNDVFSAYINFGGAVHADNVYDPVSDADEINNANAELERRGLKGTLTPYEEHGGSYMVYPEGTTIDEVWETTVVLKNELNIKTYEVVGLMAYDPVSIKRNIDALAPKGDANASGDATISDVVSVLQFGANAEKYPLDIQAQFNCDINEDNSVDAKDAHEIQVMISQ